ncbi:cytochrome P450 family protein [Labedaea rhizosphaerae]|uniref:Cytochrome P450 n=1 Tax=Labedaea rhizosphaerae TaxID=598644 RepID=A0A4R6SAW7_LABRH|nr:cytochrome P450 [Labedaea rhizosphaerae]TDP97189.1 cytochrome P450 [Labedaea rhizosphaerae]
MGASAPLELDETFVQNPHQLYELLRAQAPVRKVTMMRGLDAWLVTRYDDVRAALADPRLAKNAGRIRELAQRQAEDKGLTRPGFDASLSAHMLNADPPDHSRLRKLVNKAFTSRTVARLQPRIEQITDELLDAMAGKENVDLLDTLAFPLPITVICELLGVPMDERDDFRVWSNILLSSDQGERVPEAAQKMAEYLTKLVASKRATPTEDLLTELVEATEDGDRLSEEELVGMAFLLMVAGHETTVNLIGNGVLHLLRNPDQLAALRAHPDLLPGAVEEILRLEGPVNIATIRFSAEPITLGGQEIPAGEFVMVALSSANRDPEKFADPDTLDITRPAGGHMAFGHGIHYCVGAPLARLEGQIALGKLIARFPGLALAAEPEELVWRNSTLMRGLTNLPVRTG